MAQLMTKLITQTNMQPHEEGGFFCPIPEVTATTDPDTGRAASGAIYYALLPGDTSEFHVIDCDEYWCYHAGDPLEMWLVDPQGNLSKKSLGLGENHDPLIWVPAGTAFAAKHASESTEGTLISCITVPQFDYAGWKLLSKNEACALCPAASAFWE